jgi:hypothetical protein
MAQRTEARPVAPIRRLAEQAGVGFEGRWATQVLAVLEAHDSRQWVLTDKTRIHL